MHNLSQPIFRGNCISGKFVDLPEANGEWKAVSPTDAKEPLGVIRYSYHAVDDAVAEAKGSLKKLSREVCANGSKKALIRLSQILRNKEEPNRARLVEIMKSELGRMSGDIETELERSADWLAQSVERFETREAELTGVGFEPVGVFAVVLSFCYPIFYASQALSQLALTGNALVFKSSEKAVLTLQTLFELMSQCDFPLGRLHLIVGEKEVGRRLTLHEEVQGIFFVGSNETGTRIKQDVVHQHYKRLILNMGAKNAALIWSDQEPNLDYCVDQMLLGAYSSAGQSCLSTSRLFVHQDLIERFVKKFHEKSKAFEIGHPSTNAFMGPLIDQTAVDRFIKFVGIASREGAEVVMRAKILEGERSNNYVSPAICWYADASPELFKKSVFLSSEFLAPGLAIVGVKDLEQAIDSINRCGYGLGAAVFASNTSVVEKFRSQVQAGYTVHNHSTWSYPAAGGFNPQKKSGNQVMISTGSFEIGLHYRVHC